MSLFHCFLYIAVSSIEAACFGDVQSAICSDDFEVGQLICRENHMLAIKTMNLGSHTKPDNDATAVEFTEFPAKSPPVWIPYDETNESVLAVNGLSPNTSYLFRTKSKGDVYWIEHGPYATQTENEELQPVKNLNVSNFIYESGKVSALLTWDPGRDMSCYTELLTHRNDQLGAFLPVEIELEKLYWYRLTGLDFSVEYTSTLYTQTEDEESEHVSITFTSPPCMEVTDHNMTLCKPEEPKNLVLSSTEECNLEASWDKPLKSPHNYIIKTYTRTDQLPFQLVSEVTIPGYKLNQTINLQKDAEFVFLKLAASGPAGVSDWVENFFNNTCFPNIIKTVSGISYNKTITVWTGGSVFALILIFISISVIITYSRRKIQKTIKVDVKGSKSYMSPKKFDKDKSEQADNPLKKEENGHILSGTDRWSELKGLELAAQNVVLCQQLGKGEFGVVYRGLLTDRNPHLYVAVKSLKEGSTAEDFMKLESEAIVMAAVGHHKNIVSFFGYYRTGSHASLVVEYCSRGDLLNYLRSIPRPHPWTEWGTKPDGDTHLMAVSNALYISEGKIPHGHNTSFTISDMLSFARQISLGMEFLSLNKVVHRDLAARNVLICEDLTAKICDFGLSRDVYETTIYKRQGCDRLPLKWMAPESLAYQMFTSKSDVWSYGIVLWEMATLGECPYPSIATSQILSLLKEGYRMEKPSHCSNQLYDVMLSCWEGDPNQRPCFSKLVQEIDKIISSESNNIYLKLKLDEEILTEK